MGLSGCSCMPESLSRRSPTNRCPWYTVRPLAGKAGTITVMTPPRCSSRASLTGPILPVSVESKVEQYLKKICRGLRACSQSRAARELATALEAGVERDLSATTMASAFSSAALSWGDNNPSGMPIICTQRIPPRTRLLARSVAPVKSSAMAPNTMDMSSLSVVVGCLGQVDAGEPLVDLDHRGVVLTAEACPPGRSELLQRAGRHRCRQGEFTPGVMHEIQVLDEDVHGE